MYDLSGRSRYQEPAPYIKGGLCSDCGVAPTGAARQVDGSYDFKVCPKCYGVLWKRDFGRELRLKAQAAAEAERERSAKRRAAAAEAEAAKKAAKKAAKREAKLPSASTMTLRTQRRRLINLVWLRAQELWRKNLSIT